MSNHRTLTYLAAVLLSASFLTTNLMAADTDGVMMRGGKMMTMKDGKAMGQMEHSMTMSDGTQVMGDGTVKMKDGTETHMKDGQMMTTDGHMMDGHTMEDGHSGVMGGGSTAGMNH